MFTRELHEIIVGQGLTLLIEQMSYSQKDLFDKLGVLNFKVSKSVLSNLWKGHPVGAGMYKTAAMGILKVLEIEQCLQFDANEKKFKAIPNCKADRILVDTTNRRLPPEPTYQIFDGRRDVHQKVAFYQKANVEVIELGIRLRNFKNYFSNKRDSAFTDPLRTLLDRGINFKCYVLDPDSGFGQRYFDDRSQAPDHLFERDAMALSPEIIAELQKEFRILNQEDHPGKAELYTYDHFPYFHATVIDGATEQGQLLIAPYLYGISRANTPVIEVSRQKNAKLYKRYWKSVAAMTSTRVSSRL